MKTTKQSNQAQSQPQSTRGLHPAGRLVAAGALALGAIALGGCGQDALVEDDLCVEMTQPAVAAITATSNFEKTDTTLREDERFIVDLVDIGGPFGGFVTFIARTDDDYFFALDRNVPFAVWQGGFREESKSTRTRRDLQCPQDIAAMYKFSLQAGTHLLEFGPTGEASVSIAIEDEHGFVQRGFF